MKHDLEKRETIKALKRLVNLRKKRENLSLLLSNIDADISATEKVVKALCAGKQRISWDGHTFEFESAPRVRAKGGVICERVIEALKNEGWLDCLVLDEEALSKVWNTRRYEATKEAFDVKEDDIRIIHKELGL